MTPVNIGLRTVKFWVRLRVRTGRGHQTYLIATYRTKQDAKAAQEPNEVVIQVVGHYMPGEVKRARKNGEG